MDNTFVNIISLMAVAVILVWLFKRVKLPPILAYLFAGVVVGPEIFKLYKQPEDMHLAAEVGIVFLLFTLGLEFSLARMLAMRRLVFGVGTIQMVVTTVIFAAMGGLFNLSLTASIVIGASIALSSTAIVIKTIDEQGKLNTQRSQLAVSILLFQDLAVVPLLIIIPLLAATTEQSIGIAIFISLLKGIFIVAILLAIGKWVLPRVFNEIAKTKTEELFVLCTILIVLLAAGATYMFGLSMALGAFLAGMMLAESQYRHQLEADIRPFRDILMGLFFITVGMKLELSVLLSHWYVIVFGLIVLVAVKAATVMFASRVAKTTAEDGWAAGFKLAQMGEFSFIILALALENGLISDLDSSVLVCIALISMGMTPWLISNSGVYAARLSGNKLHKKLQKQEQVVSKLHGHVVILGFGRVGQSMARMLKLEALPYIVIDSDPIRVEQSRTAGEAIIYGDVGQKDILKSANIMQAKLAIVTFDEHEKALKVINTIKHINEDVTLIVRTRKDYDMQDLYDAGAKQVVPEVQEGSLMLISQVLHYSGVPMSRILKRIRSERKEKYQHMHGFFPGETTEISYETTDKLEFMHAIVMSENAYAVGRSLEELNLVRKKVKVIALRRQGKEYENPALDIVIAAQDVVIITAKPRRMERIEKYLLDGG